MPVAQQQAPSIFIAHNTFAMRVLFTIASLLLLTTRHGACAFVAPGGSGASMHPSFIHKNNNAARRHVSQMDDDNIDKLLSDRIEKDQADGGTDWSFVNILVSINVVLVWLLFAHGSPPIIEDETMQDQASSTAQQERIQTPSEYYQDTTAWVDASAGFYFF